MGPSWDAGQSSRLPHSDPTCFSLHPGSTPPAKLQEAQGDQGHRGGGDRVGQAAGAQSRGPVPGTVRPGGPKPRGRTSGGPGRTGSTSAAPATLQGQEPHPSSASPAPPLLRPCSAPVSTGLIMMHTLQCTPSPQTRGIGRVQCLPLTPHSEGTSPKGESPTDPQQDVGSEIEAAAPCAQGTCGAVSTQRRKETSRCCCQSTRGSPEWGPQKETLSAYGEQWGFGGSPSLLGLVVSLIQPGARGGHH
ncbi:basic salivary proline-rich protein 3-like isoform X12 [Talpa occidentalis]|uniref:basic salivary proline-rich protein 3-like isoform X12 n=1 Tax=Talpa occidentalis TaxID=50954 RepID=UPI00188F7AAF|nr:basic salivary proline-rich protein 3-like isoform X12 [Talpa occidentalis]